MTRSDFRFWIARIDEAMPRAVGRTDPCRVALLSGSTDRPRAIRTASFRDPGGHILEIAK